MEQKHEDKTAVQHCYISKCPLMEMFYFIFFWKGWEENLFSSGWICGGIYDCHHDDKYFRPQFSFSEKHFDEQKAHNHNCLENHRLNASEL